MHPLQLIDEGEKHVKRPRRVNVDRLLNAFAVFPAVPHYPGEGA